MRLQKLETTDAFIVFDLDDAPTSVGVARTAPKILVDGATTLARTNTYLFATFQQQIGGASAGINAKPEDRDAAIAAFVAEVGPLVSAGTFVPDAGRGLGEAELAPLRSDDPRPADLREAAPLLLATGIAAAAGAALGTGLEGRTVALDGIDASTPAILDALAAGGAKVVAVAGPKGSAASADGFDLAALAASAREHGPAALEQLEPAGELQPAAAVFAAEVDLLLTGSKVGAIDHEVAETVAAKVVVPTAPVPVTAKALAMLRRKEILVLPDFVTIAGAHFPSFAEDGATVDVVAAEVEHNVAGLLGMVLDHPDGPLLAACYLAEEFLRSWRETLPFGRPI